VTTVRVNVAIVELAPGMLYAVELRTAHPCGKREVTPAGLYATLDDATKRAVEVQDRIKATGGVPTAGVS
jgi:hypothetical protein